MLKKLQAKKPNEITRIKTPSRFSVHAHSLVKNRYLYFFNNEYGGGVIEKFKPLCPICNGDMICKFKSVIIPCESHFVDLSFFDDCLLCGGSGILIGSRLWCLYNQIEKRFAINLLCHQLAFKTPLDAPKFLPMVVVSK